MSGSLAYSFDDCYGENTASSSSVFGNHVWPQMPMDAPQIRDYSISSGEIISRNRPAQLVRVEFIDPSESRFRLLNEVTKSINDLLALRPGWDSYAGVPTNETAARKAISILSALVAGGSRLPSVVPTSHGGVQLEWHNNGWDVEIEVGPDGSINTFVDSQTFTHSWSNHQLPHDRHFIDAFLAVTAK